MKINQAMIESYVRNLIGQVIGAIAFVSNTSNVGLFNFEKSQWLLVANTLWASLVPVILRYVNKKDPAYGWVAEQAAGAISSKLEKETKKPTKTKKVAK